MVFRETLPDWNLPLAIEKNGELPHWNGILPASEFWGSINRIGMAFFWVTNESRAPYTRAAERIPSHKTVEGIPKVESLEGEQGGANLVRREKALSNPYERIDEKPVPRRTAPQAQQVMSKSLVTLNSMATVREAWSTISSKRFRHIPIVSVGNRPVGIISDRDILREGSLLVQDTSAPTREELLQRNLRAFMKTKLLSASPDTSIRDIAQMMFQERVGSMLITNDQARLVGIITRSDILRVITNKAPLQLWV